MITKAVAVARQYVQQKSLTLCPEIDREFLIELHEEILAAEMNKTRKEEPDETDVPT